MSMPVATYQCTACDFSGWDCVTWGYRYYQHGDLELPVHVALGWCHDCRQPRCRNAATAATLGERCD